jgi:hypothetical protein
LYARAQEVWKDMELGGQKCSVTRLGGAIVVLEKITKNKPLTLVIHLLYRTLC